MEKKNKCSKQDENNTEVFEKTKDLPVIQKVINLNLKEFFNKYFFKKFFDENLNMLDLKLNEEEKKGFIFCEDIIKDQYYYYNSCFWNVVLFNFVE